MNPLSRRDLIRLAVALPTAGLFNRYRALAAPALNRVKITGIRAMAIQNIAGNCLIRIDTDAGITGYGEAGATGPMQFMPATFALYAADGDGNGTTDITNLSDSLLTAGRYLAGSS